MYSGTTLHGKSGNLMGAHQKFDRTARKFVKVLRPHTNFPNTKQILHFEGNNGPDAIKRKSPAVDEPRHYWDPTNDADMVLLDTITMHYDSLVRELKDNDSEKSAFEAAWLAHAIVDGLTPPHHYPYEDKLTEIRGESLETRNSVKSKLVIKGNTKRQTIKRNWQMWGAKGLMMSHGFFEFGVSSMVRPLKLQKGIPTEAELRHVRNIGLNAYLRQQALEVYNYNMYKRFLKRGWTTKLAREVRQNLGPIIVNAVTVAWILAIDEAADVKS